MKKLQYFRATAKKSLKSETSPFSQSLLSTKQFFSVQTQDHNFHVNFAARKFSLKHCVKYAEIQVFFISLFSLSFQYRFYDSVVIRENKGQRTPVLSYILHSER